MNPQFEHILRAHLPFLPADEPLAVDTDLPDQGLDSLGIVDLLTSLENRYEVAFVDDALTHETFRTPGTLWQVLCGLRAVAA
jgi:acyl carrier protein